MIPREHQLVGAKFLAERQFAMLADEPRVGKTGTAIMAADLELCQRILVITTASGRAVWRRAFADWSALPRAVTVFSSRHDKLADVTIVGWPSIVIPEIRSTLLRGRWDVLIVDEAHYAKTFDSQRTRSVYGEWITDDVLSTREALVSRADRVWLLTGTPMPNSPADLFPMLRGLVPERLGAWQTYDAFKRQFCKWKPLKVGNGPWAKHIDVITGGKNLDVLRDILKGFYLRRTQQVVGIGRPHYELFPLQLAPRMRQQIEGHLNARMILEAAAAGTTKDLEMHLGTLRSATSEIKAHAVVPAVKDAFECGLDKVVLMVWHRAAIAVLRQQLAKFGVVVIDGSTSAKDREAAETRFRTDPKIRVCIGQIQAAGEAIDLSASAELWFVEASFSPKDMKQAALRITNLTQKRQALVRVCVLEGSIDEAVQKVLLRKWATIREVIQ